MPADEHQDLADDISMSFRGTGRIESDVFLTLSYHPIRGTSVPRGRRGTIDRTETQEDGRLQFVLYDEERARDIEVVLGPTTGESTVRSGKTDRWTTLGTPLRISVFEDADTFSEASNQTFREFHEGRHESVVAAAAVEWNSKILEWFEWSSGNA